MGENRVRGDWRVGLSHDSPVFSTNVYPFSCYDYIGSVNVHMLCGLNIPMEIANLKLACPSLVLTRYIFRLSSASRDHATLDSTRQGSG